MDAGSLWGGQDMPYGRAEGEEPEACVAFRMLFVGSVFPGLCVLAVKCVLVMQYSQLQVVLKTRKTSCKVQVGVRNLENV